MRWGVPEPGKVWMVARYNLVRAFRDRTNLFFVLIFPILIVAVLGAQFGSDDAPEVGVAGSGPLVDTAVEDLRESEAVQVRRASADEIGDLVTDSSVTVGVIVPDGATELLDAGDDVVVRVLVGESDEAAQVEGLVVRALERAALLPAVTGELSGESGVAPAEVAGVVRSAAAAMGDIEIDQVAAGGAEAQEFGFEQIAAGMLLLMTFLNTLTGAAGLIQSRKLGVSRRMLVSPTSIGTIVLGEGAGRWMMGVFQAVYIMVATTVLFGVAWGNLLSAIVLVVVFAAVAAGAAMLVGALMHNDEQAAGVTVMMGLGLGALGGTMLPLELFGSTMRTVAHATPHAWALEAFTVVGRGGSIGDVLPELGVLLGFAVVLIAVAAWRLRVTLTRA